LKASAVKVIKDGQVYKVARVTGPTHNFLGLVLSLNSTPTVPRVETMAVEALDVTAATIPKDEVVRQVLKGVAEANEEYGTQFRVDVIQYVPTDSRDDLVYMSLAKAIIEEATRHG
jgi:hypothetical protein